MVNNNDLKRNALLKKVAIDNEKEIVRSVNAVPVDRLIKQQEEEGVSFLTQLKLDGLTRKNQFLKLREAFDADLENWKDQVGKSLQLSKQYNKRHFEIAMEDIESNFLARMNEIGITNFEQRVLAASKLSEKANDLMNKVVDTELPEEMKTELLDFIVKEKKAVFEKLMSSEEL